MKAVVINFGDEYLGVDTLRVETELDEDLEEVKILPYLEDWFYDLYGRSVSEVWINDELKYFGWGWDFS